MYNSYTHKPPTHALAHLNAEKPQLSLFLFSFTESSQEASVPDKPSSCPLLFSPSPQETEISTRRKECEVLDAEVKKKNQTCQTLVSAPWIYFGLWMKRMEAKIDLYPESFAFYHHTQASLEKTSGSDSMVPWQWLKWKKKLEQLIAGCSICGLGFVGMGTTFENERCTLL